METFFSRVGTAPTLAFKSYYVVWKLSFHVRNSRLFFLFKFKFPYYIVRFKPVFFIILPWLFRRFPYYIVRFKQQWKNIKNLCGNSFHTTQYDLNGRIVLQPRVRTFLFPYYIVRFKPRRGQEQTEKVMSFHTTQYDLNNIKRHTAAIKTHQFPYYIVRFKLGTACQGCFLKKNVSILHSTI